MNRMVSTCDNEPFHYNMLWFSHIYIIFHCRTFYPSGKMVICNFECRRDATKHCIACKSENLYQAIKTNKL